MSDTEADRKKTILGILKMLALNVGELLPHVSERAFDLPADSSGEVTTLLRAWPNDATRQAIAALQKGAVGVIRGQFADLRRLGYPVPREWVEAKLLGELSADGEFNAGSGKGHVRLRAFMGAREAVSKLLADVRHAAWEYENAPPAVSSVDSAETPATTGTSLDTAGGTAKARWQTIRDELLAMKKAGEAFTTTREMAERFGCALATVNKALKKTLELRQWAMRRRPGYEELRKKRRAECAEAREDQDADDAIWAKLLDAATPRERARLHAMSMLERAKHIASHKASKK